MEYCLCVTEVSDDRMGVRVRVRVGLTQIVSNWHE